MTDDDKKDDFVKQYVALARRVIDYEKKQRSEKGALSLLTADWPNANLLQKDADILSLAKSLFSFDLKGLTSFYEVEPWSVGGGFLGLVAPLKFEDNQETVWQRLLYPLRNISYGYDLDISDEQIQATAGLYYKTWKLHLWPYRAVIPLHNFDSEVDAIQIGSLTLIKIENLDGYSWITDRLKTNGVKFLLVSEDRLYGETVSTWKELLEELNDAVTALRLMLPGQYENIYTSGLGLSNIYMLPFLRNQQLSYSWKAALQVRVDDTGGGGFLGPTPLPKLTAEHIAALNRYFLSKNDTLSALMFAIRRFNLSYARETEDDRLIDLTIALESCLVPSKATELKFRLSIRAATLLREKYKTAYIKAMIDCTYDIRSAIVHSGAHYSDAIAKDVKKMKVYDITRFNFLSALSEIVREALCKEIELLYVLAEASTKRPTLADLANELDAFLLSRLDIPDDGIDLPEQDGTQPTNSEPQ